MNSRKVGQKVQHKLATGSLDVRRRAEAKHEELLKKQIKQAQDKPGGKTVDLSSNK